MGASSTPGIPQARNPVLQRITTFSKGLAMKQIHLAGMGAALLLLSMAVLSTAQTRSRAKVEGDPDVPFVPTPFKVVDRMLELAEVHKGDVVYDLGCGDGRILVAAAKKYEARGVGFDIDPERVRDSIENIKVNDVEKLVTVKQADIFTLDLSGATVITLYLTPQLNVKLIPQLQKLKPGCRIVSHAFDMRGIKPNKVVSVPLTGNVRRSLYLWVTPLEKEKP
jgi:SAM-dependent methyltransferase